MSTAWIIDTARPWLPPFAVTVDLFNGTRGTRGRVAGTRSAPILGKGMFLSVRAANQARMERCRVLTQDGYARRMLPVSYDKALRALRLASYVEAEHAQLADGTPLDPQWGAYFLESSRPRQVGDNAVIFLLAERKRVPVTLEVDTEGRTWLVAVREPTSEAQP